MGFILVATDDVVGDSDSAVEVVKKGLFGPVFNKKYSDLLYITVSFVSYMTDVKI